jgi:hypothetical protein
VTDLDDPALKDRIVGLNATRDQAQADAQRAQAMLESSAHHAVTPQMLRQFAQAARNRMRVDGGGYRRDHLRLLAQRVEVADKEVRITGFKSNLLRTLVAISSFGVKSDTLGVPGFVPNGGEGDRRSNGAKYMFYMITTGADFRRIPGIVPGFDRASA